MSANDKPNGRPQGPIAQPPGAVSNLPVPDGNTQSTANGQPIIVISQDHIQRQIQQQAQATGLKMVNDFPEGFWNDEDRQHPREFPDVIGGVRVRYMSLPEKTLYEPPYGEYARAGQPVSRHTVPGLPESIFGVDGLVRNGTDLWYVIPLEVWSKIKERYARLRNLNVQSMIEGHEYVHPSYGKGAGAHYGVQTAGLVNS